MTLYPADLAPLNSGAHPDAPAADLGRHGPVAAPEEAATGSHKPRPSGIAQLLTVPEVAELLRCAPWTVKGLCASGALVASKVAGRWLISADAVTAYLDQQSNHPTPRRRRARQARAS